MSKSPRLSARALIVENDKLLLVNATPEKGYGKWCVPGGGVEKRGFFALDEMKNMHVLPAFLKSDFWMQENIVMPVYKGWEEKDK